MARTRSLLWACWVRLPAAVMVCFALAADPPHASAAAARTTITYPMKGFEDDVDLVVSPTRGFVVVCEEDNSELVPGEVMVIELDPASGAPLGPRVVRPALGFENGVDPIIVQMHPTSDGWAVLVPEESQDGSHGAMLVLRVDDRGNLLEEHSIDLAGLGFHPDVDGVWAAYIGPLIAFFALESEDGAFRGVIGIDIDLDDSDLDGDPEFGSCRVITNAPFAVCDATEFEDWIPGLADGLDPVAYEVGSAARLALPVTGAGGSDLLLLDWDPHFEPPVFAGYASVKALNAGTARPLAFPGWERDVDISLFTGGECGAFAPVPWILLPVDGGANNGDLYQVDPDGVARWVYSIDAGPTVAPPHTGYEQGVDLVRICGVGGAHPSRILIPIESTGGDADVVMVDFLTGQFLGHVEDPVKNPGTTVLGFEVGVEPLPWTPVNILVPMEGAAGAGLLTIDPDARVLSSFVGGPILGFARSVDPVVAPWPELDRTLFVPVANSAGTNSNVLRFALPPDVTAPGDLETLNIPAITFSGFEWDVDPGLVKQDPGSNFFMVPEYDRVTGAAQLRFEPTPAVAAGRVLVVPVKKVGATPASIWEFRTSDGHTIGNFTVLGLQTGLDLATGRGTMIFADPPAFGVAPGFDEDTDPTLATGASGTGVGDVQVQGEWRLAFANPFHAPGRIAWYQPRAGRARIELVDVAGRRLRRIYDGWLAAGEHFVAWDGRDASGAQIATGTYFVRLGDGLGWSTRALVILH